MCVVMFAGPVLESLMGMRGLPTAAATPLEDGVRGTNHPTKASAREGHSEDEQGRHEDKLSPLPSWTHPHKTSNQVWVFATQKAPSPPLYPPPLPPLHFPFLIAFERPNARSRSAVLKRQDVPSCYRIGT